MPFPTTSIVDAGSGANSVTPPGWTFNRDGGAGVGIQISGAKFLGNNTGYCEAYRTAEVTGNDCEAFATVNSLAADSEDIVGVFARLHDAGTSVYDCYEASYTNGTTYGAGAVIRLMKFVNGAYAQLGSDYAIAVATVGDGIGIECVGDQIAAWHRRSGTWTRVILVTNAEVPAGTKIGMELKGDSAINFGGGSYAAVTLDNVLPDADITTTGWTTTPLFSKLNDASDATVIQATAV